MAPTTKTLSILHRCPVAPASDTAELRLPLTHFDVFWLFFHPIQRLLFYQHPCSAAHFHQTIVPNFKNSLSQTLRHYLPLAGNLFYPLYDSGIPDLRYFAGDSVAVTFAEYSETADFSYLTGNQPREADEFHRFVPALPESRTDSEHKIFPLLSIQVTLFPATGIAIGVTNHHIVGDASSIVGFIKAWSAASKLDGEDEHLADKISLPIFDRSLIKDPRDLFNIYWNQMRKFKLGDMPQSTPTSKVRATFILKKSDIEKLKNLVLEGEPAAAAGSIHLSSFTVTAAYFWTCMDRADADAGHDEFEFFGFPVDCRSRMEPPAPAAYFGNCLTFVVAESRHGVIRGKDGFLAAAKLVGEVIKEKVNKKGELLRDADQMLQKFMPLIGKRGFSVAGSPKFDLYGADFGWGRPVKYEAVSIDSDANVSIALSKSREFEGGLELGISTCLLPWIKLDVFLLLFFGKILLCTTVNLKYYNLYFC